MKKNKLLLIAGIIISALGLTAAAAGLIAGAILSPANSSMVVALGIRTLNALTSAAYITAGIGAGAAVVGAIPIAANIIRNHTDTKLIETTKKEDQKKFDEYAHDSLNPEKTRIRLEQLRRNNPSLSDLIDRCLTQMDTIDIYQARHKSLLDANEAIYLEDTIEVIDNSEKRMCRNFRNIINCCILIENTDKGPEELDADIIESSLSENEEELHIVNTLLKYSVGYINNYNRSGVSDRRELDAWLKVMKDSTGGNHEDE